MSRARARESESESRAWVCACVSALPYPTEQIYQNISSSYTVMPKSHRLLIHPASMRPPVGNSSIRPFQFCPVSESLHPEIHPSFQTIYFESTLLLTSFFPSIPNHSSPRLIPSRTIRRPETHLTICKFILIMMSPPIDLFLPNQLVH